MKKNRIKIPVRFTTLCIILSMWSLQSIGQFENHLILKRKNLTNLHHYLPGDQITYIRDGNTFDESGTIQGIGPDRIIIGGQEIPVNTIETVFYNRTGFNFKAGGTTIALASPLYLALGALNSLIRGERPLWVPLNFAVAGGIVASGLAIRSLQVKKYKIGSKYQLRVVQSDPFFQMDKKSR